MLLSLLRLWTGPLPEQELFPTDRKINPLLHWIIHPVKRRIAKYYLLLLQCFFGLKVIAITGSSGKTTTKNLLFPILSHFGHTVATENNTTSTFNLPTTILTCHPGTKFLILEMSVEYPGDMGFYTWLAKPDIAVFLNANPTHLAYLGSIKNVAAEKSKIFSGLSPSGTAVFNLDDPLTSPPPSFSALSFGRRPGSYCHIISSQLQSDLTLDISLSVNSCKLSFSLPLIDENYASNLAAVICVCSALKLDLFAVPSLLSTITPTPRRLNPIALPHNSLLIDDTHNANPAAVVSSLHTLSRITKLTHRRPVFVFAQMNELGEEEKSAHREIGLLLKKLEITDFFCLGPATRYALRTAGFGRYYDDLSSLIPTVKQLLNENRKLVILVKGSRSWHLEQLVSALLP